jgi:hypothetical protein
MNAKTSPAPATDADDAAVAFEVMSRKLAGLTAAMEGFAARQQELHARDYGPDLARIHDVQVGFQGTIEGLSKRPAMELTPQQMEKQIEAAGGHVRSADHHAWLNAHRELQGTIQSVRGVVASAVEADKQNRWLLGVAAAALVVGSALGMIVPPLMTSAAPESWYWPERKAVGILGRDGWNSGMRLLQVYEPQRSRALTEASQLVSANQKELADCRSRALEARSTVRCTIKVDGPVQR